MFLRNIKWLKLKMVHHRAHKGSQDQKGSWIWIQAEKGWHKSPSNKSKFLPVFRVKYFTYHRMHTATWEDQPGGGDASRVVDWRSRADIHEFLEGLAKLGVEDRVYHRVDEAVHVTEPGGDDEGRQRGLTRRSQLSADRVHHVAREERHPAEQEHTCTQSETRSIKLEVFSKSIRISGKKRKQFYRYTLLYVETTVFVSNDQLIWFVYSCQLL